MKSSSGRDWCASFFDLDNCSSWNDSLDTGIVKEYVGFRIRGELMSRQTVRPSSRPRRGEDLRQAILQASGFDHDRSMLARPVIDKEQISYTLISDYKHGECFYGHKKRAKQQPLFGVSKEKVTTLPSIGVECMTISFTRRSCEYQDLPEELQNIIRSSDSRKLSIPDNCVHLVVTSPPYNASKAY